MCSKGNFLCSKSKKVEFFNWDGAYIVLVFLEESENNNNRNLDGLEYNVYIVNHFLILFPCATSLSIHYYIVIRFFLEHHGGRFLNFSLIWHRFHEAGGHYFIPV